MDEVLKEQLYCGECGKYGDNVRGYDHTKDCEVRAFVEQEIAERIAWNKAENERYEDMDKETFFKMVELTNDRITYHSERQRHFEDKFDQYRRYMFDNGIYGEYLNRRVR